MKTHLEDFNMKIDNRSNSFLGTLFAILIAIGTSLAMVGFTLSSKGKKLLKKLFTLTRYESDDDDE